ncbi:dithiol-disulfide isomerase [Bacillus paranthracis]|uniref:dithiol-disulfide isomerase n=1 Tax=Bacillus cereus group sp. RP29 TaxID=3040257 RepID=UPI0021513B15|nr:dithiol-disulfide isomerase [Bacillus paranthracis]MCR6462815.1 dithiol-disulfide isomerase [Bacillus paranthracis]MCR9018925.1 dithiol-disulfide isomerase [Bacillus paranthracis]
MTPINAVIPMMRAATVTKSIKKAIICKFPLCLSVFLLYEIKDEKERNVRKNLIYFRNRMDMNENVC